MQQSRSRLGRIDADWVSRHPSYATANVGNPTDALHGTDGNDIIRATKVADWVYGGSGDDLIDGNEGNDNLFGEAGSDTFEFATGDGTDQIRDYSSVAGVIQFIGLRFADISTSQVGGNIQIDYGSGDRLLIDNAQVTDFSEAEFQFV